MNVFEALDEMLAMQEEYDLAVFKEHGIEDYESIDTEMQCALLDEIGEFNHELKPLWCWWKKTQKPLDLERVYDEFADIIHFCLMGMIGYGSTSGNLNNYDAKSIKDNMFMFTDEYAQNLDSLGGPSRLSRYIATIKHHLAYREYTHIINKIRFCLGLTWDEVYSIYKRKNKINWQRLKEGY